MFLNATLKVYTPTKTKNTEGDKINTWGYKLTPVVAPAETLRADVQPYITKAVDLERWGISKARSNTKKAYFKESTYITELSRVNIVSDKEGDLGYFEIKDCNIWPIHGKCLLVPVVGE